MVHASSIQLSPTIARESAIGLSTEWEGRWQVNSKWGLRFTWQQQGVDREAKALAHRFRNIRAPAPTLPLVALLISLLAFAIWKRDHTRRQGRLALQHHPLADLVAIGVWTVFPSSDTNWLVCLQA